MIMALVGLLFASGVSADTIVLKDGSREESDRVWESEAYVHFILKGTQTVEIRYAKEIVERIEHEGLPQPIDSQQAGKSTTSREAHILHPEPSPAEQKNEQTTEKRDSATVQIKDTGVIKANRGINFYNPRRPKRYWSSRNLQHTSLEAAIAALAGQYGRSSQWVEDHIGEENDLGVIHFNLLRQLNAEKTIKSEGAKISAPSGNLFYDVRREMPFSAGANRYFKTRAEALEDLARQYGNSVQWIENHMGSENQIDVIHAKLAKASSPSPKPISEKNQISPFGGSPAEVKGIKFYDPRRSNKYWTSKKRHHSTLKEAVKALAEQYRVSPEWIENNFGESNELSEIHRRIQKRLRPKLK